MHRLALIIGTRPEAIKLAPVYEAAAASRVFDPKVVLTGQHREILDQAMSTLGLPVEVDLQIMKPDQRLCDTAATALVLLQDALARIRPDCVVVQGDTTTSFCGALAAFYLQIPVAHVEAGLRTHDRSQPFPEEMYRSLISRIADYHFAPTAEARDNLLRENMDPARIWVVGNTAVDAIFRALRLLDGQDTAQASRKQGCGRRILLTLHRRENHGLVLVGICRAILDLVRRHDDLRIVFPVHPNPAVRSIVLRELADDPRITLCEPVDHTQFVSLMRESHLILTDSGGVQEEAPSLGKPVLVLRNNTERSEAVEAGVARIIGTERAQVVRAVSELLEDETLYRSMSKVKSPFGDGHTADRIIAVLRRTLGRAMRERELLSG